MAILVDSYSETNVDSTFDLCSDCTLQGLGMTFTAISANLDNCQFYLRRQNLPTGNAVAKLYDITGTFGLNAIPDGAALAVSDALDVSTLPASPELISFNFSGANRVALTNGNHYAITLEYSGGSGTDSVLAGADTSGPFSYSGNEVALVANTWFGGITSLTAFYVYGVVPVFVDLTGVAASPAVGTGTVQISGAVSRGIGEPVRLPRRKPQPSPEPIYITPPPLPIVHRTITRQGVAASATIGAGNFDVGFKLSPLNYRYIALDARAMIDVSFPIGGPIPVTSLGQGTVTIGIELSLEEIAALLDAS